MNQKTKEAIGSILLGIATGACWSIMILAFVLAMANTI